MNGSSNTVLMTDCNHAAKNMCSQLVLGSIIITAGDAVFDVGLLRIAGVSLDLYCVNDYASDVLVIKICSGQTIGKSLSLVEDENKNPFTVAFITMTLYFLRTFICAYNGDDINPEGHVTMLWSSLMWFTSLDGIHLTSQNNFITSCLGGIFLALKKKLTNLRMTTTEPLEHAFGTARGWRREFTVNEFITYCNKLEILMKNLIQSDIKQQPVAKDIWVVFKDLQML